MATIDIRELFGEEEQEQKSSYIKASKHEICSYQIYLDEDIGEPKQYRDLLNLLYTCSEDTEFNIFINTSGGSLSSAMAIIEAIKNTNGLVRAIITGEAHSAGSIIALSCHEIVVTDSAHMMVHTASAGHSGTISNIKLQSAFSDNYINKILDTTYIGFLSNIELSQVKLGVEIWLDSTEIISRLKARQELLEQKTIDTTAAEKKALKKASKAS